MTTDDDETLTYMAERRRTAELWATFNSAGRTTQPGDSHTMTRLAAIDPTKNIPGAPSPDVAKKLRAIAEILGIPEPLDTGKIRQALEPLLEEAESAPTTEANIAASARRLGLSARETAMLQKLKVDPAAYAKTKAAYGGGYKPRPQR